MADSQLHQVVLRNVEVQLKDRRRHFASAVGTIVQSMISRGLYHSSKAQVEVCRAIAAEFDARAELIWQAFSRALQQLPQPARPAWGSLVKTEIVRLLETGCDDLAAQHA